MFIIVSRVSRGVEKLLDIELFQEIRKKQYHYGRCSFIFKRPLYGGLKSIFQKMEVSEKFGKITLNFGPPPDTRETVTDFRLKRCVFNMALERNSHLTIIETL